MKLNKLALCGAAVVGSLGMMGCPSDPPPTTHTDAGPIATDSGPVAEPVTVTYIVGTIAIPPAPVDGVAPGFNLDGIVSTGDNPAPATCEDVQPDYRNGSGETGVDNELVGHLLDLIGGLAGDLDVQATVDEQISTGALLIAMRVSDINSFVNDTSVGLDIFLVDPAGCATSPCAPTGGAVSAGASWTQQAGPALASGLTASIVSGKLQGGPLDLPLHFSASGRDITLTIRRAQVGGDISESRLANGNIGGELLISDIVELAEQIQPGIGSTAEGLLRDYADLSPSAADPQVCDSISAGVGFSGVPGTITAP